jgi:hypothetical protein
MCPLVMMGDWRSGRELLDQADQDFRTDLGRAWGKFGHNLMQFLSLKCRVLEEVHLRQQGQEGHGSASPRCIRASDPPQLLSSDAAGLGCWMTACPSPMSTHIPARWARGPLLHLWALGYRSYELAALFDALPSALLDPLCRALDALDSLDARRRAALSVAHGAVAAAAGSHGPGKEMVGGETDGLDDPGALWEAEREAGYLSVSYDAGTGRRLCVGLNRRQAELVGERRCEVLQRIAAQAMPLPAPQADVLACLAHELDRPAQVRCCGHGPIAAPSISCASRTRSRTHPASTAGPCARPPSHPLGQARIEQYLRVAVGPMAMGALLHRVQATFFDALGRVSRVRPPQRPRNAEGLVWTRGRRALSSQFPPTHPFCFRKMIALSPELMLQKIKNKSCRETKAECVML